MKNWFDESAISLAWLLLIFNSNEMTPCIVVLRNCAYITITCKKVYHWIILINVYVQQKLDVSEITSQQKQFRLYEEKNNLWIHEKMSDKIFKLFC